MYKQLEFHTLQKPKKGCCWYRADIQEHKNRGNLVGNFGLVKLGRPTKHASKNTKTKGAESNKTLVKLGLPPK